MHSDITVIIEKYARQSHVGEIDFGAQVARLVEVGVESYHVDYRRGEITYYLPSGETHAMQLHVDSPVAEAFDAARVRDAVRGAQRGEVLYPEFVRRTTAAGCVGYDVWIAGQHVVYHGRRGERLVEPFPGSPGSRPRANVEVVQRVYEAFGRRDLAAVFGLLAVEVEIVQSPEVPWGGRYRGHDEARGFFAKLTGAINSTLVLDRFIDAGDEVVAIGRTQGIDRSGDHRYDVPIAHVWTIRGGQVVRAQFCIDNPTMLAALA